MTVIRRLFANLRTLGTGILSLVWTGDTTFTVPATGTAALLEIANLFTARQDIRASGSGVAAGLHVPWQSGDTLPALYAGSSNTSNNRSGVEAASYSGNAISGTSVFGHGFSGTSISNAAFAGFVFSSSGSTDQDDVAILVRNTNSTPAANFGGFLALRLKSSTTNGQDAAQVVWAWADATDATRSADIIFRANYTTTAREILRGRGGSSDAQIGFLGATPVSRPSVTGSRGGNAALASLLTALANLGLITDNTTA